MMAMKTEFQLEDAIKLDLKSKHLEDSIFTNSLENGKALTMVQAFYERLKRKQKRWHTA